MKLSLLILACVALIISSCAQNQTLPDWITEFEHDPRYYSSLAIVNTHNPDYRMIARDYAAQEIAMQISANIEAEITLKESEISGIADTQYLSLVRGNTRASLQDLSPVRSHSDGSKYYVWYRISKADYLAQRMRERDLALSKIRDWLDKHDLDGTEPASKIIFLVSALDQIADFLDMDLRYKGKDLGTELFGRLHDLTVALDYRWDQDTVLMIAKDSNPRELSGAVSFGSSKDPAARIPLSFQTDSIELSPTTISDANGRFELLVTRIDSFEREQYISLGFDHAHYEHMFGSTAAYELFRGLHFASKRIKVLVSRPKIYLDYAYVSGYQGGYKDSITGYLANLNLDATSKLEEAQYILEIRIFAKPGDYISSLDYYTAFADIQMTLKDPENGATINYVEQLNFKSGGSSRQAAARNTEKEAAELIGDGLLYRFLYEYLIR